MNAFLAGCAAALVIAVGAHFALDSLGHSAANVYATDNVNLESAAE